MNTVVTVAYRRLGRAFVRPIGRHGTGRTAHPLITSRSRPEVAPVRQVVGGGDAVGVTAMFTGTTLCVLQWMENSGSSSPSFTIHNLSTGACGGGQSVQAVDVDADGDLDIVRARAPPQCSCELLSR